MFETIENMTESEHSGNGRFMFIREVSALTGVPPHTLRFWEKQMPDVLRPERTPGGQRRYSAEMTARARMIKRLADEKRYSLAAIRERLAASGELAARRPFVGKSATDEHAVELIVDEVADLLKERLLDLLETAKNGENRESRPAPGEAHAAGN